MLGVRMLLEHGRAQLFLSAKQLIGTLYMYMYAVPAVLCEKV